MTKQVIKKSLLSCIVFMTMMAGIVGCSKENNFNKDKEISAYNRDTEITVAENVSSDYLEDNQETTVEEITTEVISTQEQTILGKQQ